MGGVCAIGIESLRVIFVEVFIFVLCCTLLRRGDEKVWYGCCFESKLGEAKLLVSQGNFVEEIFAKSFCDWSEDFSTMMLACDDGLNVVCLRKRGMAYRTLLRYSSASLSEFSPKSPCRTVSLASRPGKATRWQ